MISSVSIDMISKVKKDERGVVVITLPLEYSKLFDTKGTYHIKIEGPYKDVMKKHFKVGGTDKIVIVKRSGIIDGQ